MNTLIIVVVAKLFILRCPITDLPFDVASVIAEYLPLHAILSGRCPFTLILVGRPIGMVKQPSSNSRTFSGSCNITTMGQRIQDSIKKPAATELSASSVIGFLLSYPLYRELHEFVSDLLSTAQRGLQIWGQSMRLWARRCHRKIDNSNSWSRRCSCVGTSNESDGVKNYRLEGSVIPLEYFTTPTGLRKSRFNIIIISAL